MAEYLIQDTTLTGIADAIRGKTGETGAIPVPDMASKIDGIQTGGGSSGGGGAFDPSPFSQILIGSYTPAANSSAFTIPTEATGKVGLLVMFNHSISNSNMAQLYYNTMGILQGDEAAFYKYALSLTGSLSTSHPSISTDGRTFTTAKTWMFAAGVTFTYVLGMVSE